MSQSKNRLTPSDQSDAFVHDLQNLITLIEDVQFSYKIKNAIRVAAFILFSIFTFYSIKNACDEKPMDCNATMVAILILASCVVAAIHVGFYYMCLRSKSSEIADIEAKNTYINSGNHKTLKDIAHCYEGNLSFFLASSMKTTTVFSATTFSAITAESN